ncbi:MAG: hypothetical protein AAF602_30815 [Myxococcota bacterium]
MIRRIITFLLVTVVTAALSTWWLYEGNVRAVAPLDAPTPEGTP